MSGDGTRIRLDESEVNDDPVFVALVNLTRTSEAYMAEVLHTYQKADSRFYEWRAAIERAKALLAGT